MGKVVEELAKLQKEQEVCGDQQSRLLQRVKHFEKILSDSADVHIQWERMHAKYDEQHAVLMDRIEFVERVLGEVTNDGVSNSPERRYERSEKVHHHPDLDVYRSAPVERCAYMWLRRLKRYSAHPGPYHHADTSQRGSPRTHMQDMDFDSIGSYTSRWGQAGGRW